MNFLSYADLCLDCCVSLILRRKVFFLVTHENSVFCLKTVSMYIKGNYSFVNTENTPQGQTTERPLFLFSCCKVRICGVVYKIIVYFMRIFLYNKTLMADKLKNSLL